MSTFSCWTGYSRDWKEKPRASIPCVRRMTRTSPPSPKRYPAAPRRCGGRTESAASDDGEAEDPLRRDTPWLAGLYAHGVRGRIATGPNTGKRMRTWGGGGESEE